MNEDTALHDQQGRMIHPHYHLMRHWPAMLAVLAIGGIFAVLSAPLSPGPRGLLLGLIVVLLIPLILSLRHGQQRLEDQEV